MRLGGPVFHVDPDPQAWVSAVKKARYRAAYCPLSTEAALETIAAYASAARAADIVISEVGAWSNPLSADAAEQARALDLCKASLLLAERIGANCCVNIAGSRGAIWDGPHPLNLTPETFDQIVDVVREIIDGVKPTHTFYALETMPWMYPDSNESYLDLIHAVDRKAFAAHLDPVNLICSPQRYYNNSALIRDCFEKLGPWIKSCHAKDIILANRMTVHLDEIRAGLGRLDYSTYLREASRLPFDVPIMLEHLEKEEDYILAGDYIRSVAAAENLPL